MTLTPYEGIFVYGPQDPRGRFLSELGFAFPDDLNDAIPEEFGGSISPERADLIDLDALVWLDDGDPIGDVVPTYAPSPWPTGSRRAAVRGRPCLRRDLVRRRC